MRNYYFDTIIEKDVLENYLSRAVTAAFFVHTKTLEDDLRALKNMGVKFIGRASGIWEPDEDDEEHFSKSKYLADRVHEIDPDIILQACIFEAVYRHIENFKVPAYVFEAFGMETEDRGFCFEKMRFPQKPRGFIWGEDGALPDINELETRLWFYYRATRYIDAGYEALHMGQIHLYTANDLGMVKMAELTGMIRDYARIHGRRHKVLLDAHSHGISIRGKLLLDYHAMPFTRYPLLDRKGEKLVLVREGFSEGGENPNGFCAEVMPYLMEYDNWGGKVTEDFHRYSYEERAWMDWWGYDQIGWFANQDEEGQKHFLEYTYKWTAVNNVNAYFEIPFRRTLDKAAVYMKRADNAAMDYQDYYQINEKSPACPMGFSQEETVKRLWETGDALRKKAGNPPGLLDYGAKNVYDEATGMKLPEKIVVYGSFQPFVGAIKNDSNSEITRMYYIGDNTYTLSVVMPYAGEYDYAVSTYGTLSATYCYDTYPRSGSSNKGFFKVEKDNTVVRFRYRFMDNLVTIEMFED
ncbi:hypothetical protein [Anaerocolumna xylanovorans]|uniref:Uncharacterized protein n=1 Tax=Anaerocolumna xylanovorans DSM 12503 TaxID=1121345 RepID=A0A1M7YKR1_9FIRM|nr:hypothetical protein [Anaerocolumna xylanovorans]SHO53221.1 hypothetical protein SAMN02745217_04005 [Anaerocolumna xylanovorans DSM 12503]